MKKTFLFLFLFPVLTLFSQNEITFSYHFEKPTIISTKRGNIVEFPGLIQIGKSGEPLLPYKAIKLMLPPGCEAYAMKINPTNEIVLAESGTNIRAKGSARKYSYTGEEDYYQNEAIYKSGNIYPQNRTGETNTQYMHGVGYALNAITPVNYTPSTGRLSYYEKIEVVVRYKKSERAEKAIKNLVLTDDNLKTCIDYADNKKEMDKYPLRKSSASDYEILIITPNIYTDPLKPLDSIYTNRGYRTKITSLESITSSTQGIDSPEKMRNYIINEYQNHAIKYVTLAGDADILPYRGLYCVVQSSFTEIDDNIPSDIYFSALDGNWNNNNNDLWGEVGEEDLLPEVFVGRMPFSDISELIAIVNKSIKHQNHPIIDEIRKPLLAGERLHNNPYTVGSQYLELVIGTHSENGYTTVGIDSTRNFLKLYEESYPWNGTTLRNRIKEGRNQIHHSGHADATFVMKFNLEDITSSNFESVDGVNHTFPIVYTHGCVCGSFDNDDCIGERMVAIDNFAAAFIGNSRYGWFNEGQTEGPTVHLHREYVDAVNGDSIPQIGKAHTESKRATAPWVNAPGQFEEGAQRWSFYCCNLLGDPVMSVWTDEPIDINVTLPENIQSNAYSTSVTVKSNNMPAKNLRVAVVANGKLMASGITDNNGAATLSFFEPFSTQTEANIIVSGYNCLPHSYQVPVVGGSAMANVHFESYSINDEEGNNNGVLEYGETIKLNVSLKNSGNAIANNVNATITSDNEYIDILQNSANFGNINPNATLHLPNAFKFAISENIPDNHEIVLKVASQQPSQWESEIKLNAHSYALAINGGELSNGNIVINAHDQVNINFHIENNGSSSSPALIAEIACSSEFVTIPNKIKEVGNISPGEQAQLVFENISVSPNIQNGTTVEFTIKIKNANNTIATYNKIFAVGMVTENFETGTFTYLQWNNVNNKWSISNTAHGGNYSATVNNVNVNEDNSLIIEMKVISEAAISFWYKTATGNADNKLLFAIDNEQMGEYHGENSWTQVSYNVTPGNKKFSWKYSKNNNANNDVCFIDDIIFPPSEAAINSINNIYNNDNFIHISPNPSSGIFALKIKEQSNNTRLSIANISGHVIFEKKLDASESIIDISNQPKGVYLLTIIHKGYVVTKKILIH